MIIRWGRKGLVAAAFAVSFVTPDATVTTSVHKADLHPSYKQVVRHVTPTGVAGPSSTIHKADLHPSYKLVVRHITPTEGVAVKPQRPQKGGTFSGSFGGGDNQRRIKEEEELILMLAFLELIG